MNRFTKYWLIVAWISILSLAVFLRTYQLDSNPRSLYWEEVALGYDAYSIFKTGRDFHGTSWPLVAFESFGDWKPSLYFYAIVPFIAVIGLNEWAVRLPSAIAGIAIVVGIGWLSRRVLADQMHAQAANALGMLVAAISPWAIIFSRGGWEANLATALLLWGVLLFGWFLDRYQEQLSRRFSLKREKQVMFWFICAIFLLCLAVYAYHAARVVAPLLGVGLVAWWGWLTHSAKSNLWQSLREFMITNARFILVGVGVSLLLLLPVLLSLTDVTTQQRFNETNIFADLSLLQKSQELQALAGNTWLSKILFHRYVMYGQAVLENILAHFKVDFLFVAGDENVRHSVQFMGQLYHVDIIFVLLGLSFVLKRRRPIDLFLLWWLLVGIFPAALTKAVPHALRILPTLPVWLVLITVGIVQSVNILSTVLVSVKHVFLPRIRTVVLVAFICFLASVYVLEFVSFWRFYTLLYPVKYAGAFNDGDKQMIIAMRQLAEKNPDLPQVIMRSRGRPSVYYWFFNQTDPRRVQIVNQIVSKDQGEYLEFENVRFPVKADEVVGPALVATTLENYQAVASKPLDLTDSSLTIIKDTTGMPIWILFIKS